MLCRRLLYWQHFHLADGQHSFVLVDSQGRPTRTIQIDMNGSYQVFIVGMLCTTLQADHGRDETVAHLQSLLKKGAPGRDDTHQLSLKYQSSILLDLVKRPYAIPSGVCRSRAWSFAWVFMTKSNIRRCATTVGEDFMGQGPNTVACLLLKNTTCPFGLLICRLVGPSAIYMQNPCDRKRRHALH